MSRDRCRLSREVRHHGRAEVFAGQQRFPRLTVVRGLQPSHWLSHYRARRRPLRQHEPHPDRPDHECLRDALAALPITAMPITAGLVGDLVPLPRPGRAAGALL